MKYWLFQNNQIAGPYDREELAQLQGFSPESLVCPEGRRGTEMGDWSRAGVIPELAESLLKSPRVATIARGGSLPPEPTLRDLAALGTLQEKASLLENAVRQFQEDLRSRDLEISRLKVDLAQKERALAEMQGKLSEMEASIVSLAVVKKQTEELSDKAAAQEAGLADLRQRLVEAKDELRQDTAKTADEERTVAAKLEEEGRLLAELQQRLDSMQGELGRLEARRPMEAAPVSIDVTPRPLFEPLPAPAPQAAFPSPFPAVKAEPEPPPEALIVPVVPAPAAPPAPLPAAAPPAGLTTGFADLSVTPSPAAEASAEARPGRSRSVGGSFSDPTVPGAVNAPGAATPEAAGMTADLGLEPSPKRKLPVAMIAGLLALGGTGGLYLMSGKLWAPRKSPVPSREGLPLSGTNGTPPLGAEPAPASPAAPPAPSPAKPADPSQAAVDFAKSYRLPDGVALGSKLEAAFPSAGGLSPWMVEKSGDDNFEVRYYHSGPKKKTGVFEFTVRPKAAVLQGNNPTAAALLRGEDPAPPPPAKAKPRRRSRVQALKAAKQAGGGPIETDKSLDELLLPGLEQPVKPRKKK